MSGSSWTIRWRTGVTDTAASPSDLLDVIAEQQKASAARDNIRAALAWRCWVLYRETPDITLQDGEFIDSCAAIGLFDVVHS